jgi:hypothetical protein
MNETRKTARRRFVRLGLPVLLASMPLLTGCAAAVPTLMAGTYAIADIVFLPLRSVVGSYLLAFINGTL